MPISFTDLYSQSARRFAKHYHSYALDYRLNFAALDDELVNLIRALAIYNQLKAWPNMAQLIQELGVYLETRGYWNEHRLWLEKSIAHKDMISSPITKMEIIEDLATIVSSQGNRELACDLYQDVIVIAENEKDEMRLARAYFGLGTVYLNLDNKEDAKACLEKALEIAERINDETQVVSIRFFLESLNLLKTETQISNGNLQFSSIPESHVVQQDGDQGNAFFIQLRAMKYFMQRRYHQARAKYLEALDILKEEGDKQGVAISLYQLGQIAHQENNLVEAMEYYRQSESIAKQMGDRTGLRSLYSSMSLACIQQQRFDLARPFLEQSIILEREAGDQTQLAERLYWLGYAFANTGEPKRAKNIFEESLAIFSQLNSQRVKDVRDVLHRLSTLMSEENG